MKLLEKKKIFNSSGDDTLENRKILSGSPTNILNKNNVKYKWYDKL